VFGRFEASRPNELWTGDALHGPQVGGRKTYLFFLWNAPPSQSTESTFGGNFDIKLALDHPIKGDQLAAGGEPSCPSTGILACPLSRYSGRGGPGIRRTSDGGRAAGLRTLAADRTRGGSGRWQD
jgi:hypothetical protein